MKLVRVRDVELYPSGGFADRVWDDDPAWDALAKSARRVSERYTEILAGSSVLMRSSLVRLFHVGQSPDDSVHIEVHLDFYETFESATVMLPEAATGWSADLRADVALEVQHQTCLVLAKHLGIDPAVFETARAKVAGEGIDYTWHGPWKSAPGRRHRARLAQRILESGFSELWIEVSATGSETVLGRSRPALSGGSLRAFKDAQASLKWQGRAGVTCDAMDQTARFVEPLIAHLDDLVSDSPRLPGTRTVGEALPKIEVGWFSTSDPNRPAEVVIEASINGYPGLAPQSFKRAIRTAARMTELLLPWWQESGWETLSIRFDIDKDRYPSTTHKDGRDLEVWVSVLSSELNENSGAQQAMEAIEKGLVLAARRAKLTPCTPLDDVRAAVLNEARLQTRRGQN